MAERSISYAFRANFDQFKASLSSAGSAVSDFGAKLEAEQDTAQTLTEKLEVISDTAAKVGVSAGAGFALATTAAANFEESMSQVQAATGESVRAMGELRQAALDAGAQTVFSATEASAAIENLAKAGVSTKDILGGALGGSLDLAAAGTLEVADAAEYIATALTQFSLEGEQAAHVADLLAAGAGKAQGEVADMANALNYAGVPAANLGVTIEETSGAIALLAKNGIIGEQAGTSLRGMLASLTSPSAVAKKKMDELGISVFNAEGKFVGFEGIAGQLQERMSGLTDAERANALGRIFGNEQLQAANVLYREGAEGVATWTKNVDDAGFAQEQASTKLDNLKGDFEGLKGALETALIGTGDGQLGPLRKITQSLSDLVNAYNGLPPVVQGAVGKVLGITALLAGAVFFGAKAIGSVVAMKAQLIAVTTAAQRARAAMVGLNLLKFGGLLIALTVLDQALEKTFKTRVNSTDLQRNLEALTRGKVSDDLKRLGEDLQIVSSGANGAAEPIREVGTVFGLLGDTAVDKATKNIEDLDQALASMVEAGEAGKAREIFAELLEVIRQGGGSQMDAIEMFDAFGTALENSSEAADATAGAIDDVGDAAADADPEVAALAEALKKARDEASGAVESFVDLTAGIKDGKFNFQEWVKALENSANAIRNFRRNANTALGKGLDADLVAELQGMGAEGAMQLEFLAGATDKQIERVNRAFRKVGRQTEKTVDQMTEDILALDAVEASPKVEIDVGPFNASASAIEERLRRLNAKRIIEVAAALNPFDGSADGSTVPKDGGTYRDRYPYLLAPGEEVISNRFGQADRFRPLLKAINAGRLADGGTALAFAQSQRRQSGGYASAAMGVAPIDYERLAAVVGSMRPLVGTQVVQPHDYNEFRREQEADQRRAAIGGVPWSR